MQITSTIEEAASKQPARTSPRIIVFISEDMPATYHIIIEKKEVCEPIYTSTKAILIWAVCHYAFHLQYNKFAESTAMFLFECVLQMAQKGKKSATYLSVCTDISKLC